MNISRLVFLAKQIKDKNLAILLLCVTAGILAFVNFSLPAKADTVLKGPDYQMITAKGSNGGQDFYVLDARLGAMLVFVFDTTRHTPVARQTVSVTDLFAAPVR